MSGSDGNGHGPYELVTLNGPHAGRVIPLAPGRAVVLGRATPSDVIIPEPTLSGGHARLAPDEVGYRIEDLGSTNGTRINGRLLSSRRLEDGDLLRLGDLQILFRSAGAPGTGPAPAVVESDLLGARRPQGRAFLPAATLPDASGEALSEPDVPNLLFEIGRIGGSAGPQDADERELVRQVLDLVRRFLDSDRVAFQPAGRDGLGDYVTITGLGDRIPRIPRSVLAEVREGRTVTMAFGQAPDRRPPTTTVVEEGIETLVCAPVEAGGEALGILYADRIVRSDSFDRRAAEALTAAADLLAFHLARLRAVKRTIEFERHLQECQSEALDGLLATGIAHDLANLVASLSAHAQVAAEDPEEQAAFPGHALRLADRAGRALRTILALGGRKDEPRTTFDVRATVGHVAALLEGRARSTGVATDLDLDSRSCLVEGKCAEILDALIQLGLNALAASGAGAHLRLSARRDHGSVVLAVADSGAGIPPERLREILERRHEGPGYGLQLVRRIVEAHGGSFTLTSRVGRGTTAQIALAATRALPTDS